MRHKNLILAGLALALAAPLTSACISIDVDKAYVRADADPADLYLTTISTKNFATTMADLTRAIETRGFRIFTIVDHAAGARRVDQELQETSLIIFGNPKGGTPLMQTERYMGLELPLKALVWQEGETVRITTTDITRLSNVFGLTEKATLISKIDTTLADIRDEAAR